MSAFWQFSDAKTQVRALVYQDASEFYWSAKVRNNGAHGYGATEDEAKDRAMRALVLLAAIDDLERNSKHAWTSEIMNHPLWKAIHDSLSDG